MRVAEPAVAAPGDAGAVARLHQLGQQRLLVLGQHLRAGRHLDHHVLADTPVRFLPMPPLPLLALKCWR